MMKSSKTVLYDGIPQDEVEDGRKPPYVTSVNKKSPLNHHHHNGLRYSMIVFGITLLIGLTLAVALPIVYTRQTMAIVHGSDGENSDKLSGFDDYVIDGSDTAKNNEIGDVDVQDTDDGKSEDEAPLLPNKEEPEDHEDTTIDHDVPVIDYVPGDEVLDPPQVDPDEKEKDDQVEREKDKDEPNTEEVVENEEEIGSTVKSQTEYNDQLDTDANEDTTLKPNEETEPDGHDLDINKTDNNSEDKPVDEPVQKPPSENDGEEQGGGNEEKTPQETEDENQNLDETIPPGGPKSFLDKIETWLGSKTNVSATVAAIAAASTVFGVTLILFGFSCLLRKRHKKNRRVTIKNMVTDLQSPDKVILLNGETSEDEYVH